MNSLASRIASRLARSDAAACSQLQALRNVFSVGNKEEPAASPWIKVLERPGDAAENRSEEPPVVPRPESMKGAGRADDASEDVPEKNPNTMPQAPIDPEVLAANDANTSQDSVRYMADKLNQAVGGGADFPKTGGASVRKMASEIGSNIADKVRGDQQ